MRGGISKSILVGTLLLVASCRFPIAQDPPSCDDDVSLCPHSSRSATSVTCDCHCTLGLTEDTGDNFVGPISVCLPPDLNPQIATSPAERHTLEALDSTTFDQRVYQYCSHTVARFMRATIRTPGRVFLTCAMPVTCTCKTSGATRDAPLCHTPCKDTTCDVRTCTSVLRTDNSLDLRTCYCSRASACDVVTPPTGEAPVCNDWTASSKGPAPELN